jgi:starch-binding outer membrane protein, SusD/RagB family
MIRFGTYNSAYRFHDADKDAHVNLFPIPESQLNANPNLKQNPGY